MFDKKKKTRNLTPQPKNPKLEFSQNLVQTTKYLPMIYIFVSCYVSKIHTLKFKHYAGLMSLTLLLPTKNVYTNIIKIKLNKPEI